MEICMGQMEDLKLYVQVVEQGSISKAASILRIAKSAVSRRISILEERYSSVLIDRTPGKWEITKVGLDLYQRSRALVAEFEEVNETSRVCMPKYLGHSISQFLEILA